MTLHWTETAAATLDASLDYLCEEEDQGIARTVEGRIITRAGELLDFPNAGRVVPELDAPRVREVFSGSYRIIYRLDDVKNPARIDILGVVHGSQLLENTIVWSLLED